MAIFKKGYWAELKAQHEPEPERVSKEVTGQKLLWYPSAIRIDCGMKSRGSYPDKYPMGAIVHWTSGWSRDGDHGNSANKFAENSIRSGAKDGYAFFTISESGQVYQALPLDKYGYHAGDSKWPTLGSGVSSKLVGIEVCCAGGVKPRGSKFVSWFGAEFKASEVRESEKKDNIQRGFYHKYSEAQEKSLRELCIWLYKNNPTVFKFDFILGHDEAAYPIGRKSDPGGSLSMTMPEFRVYLKTSLGK